MAELTSYADPMLATVTVLRVALTTRTEDFAEGATVGTLVPFTRTPESPSLPLVVVRVDAARSRDRNGTDERATVRVAVWHTSESDGYALARLCQSLLLAYKGDGSVRSFAPLIGVVPTSDPESGDPLSSFTVEARMRPVTL